MVSATLADGVSVGDVFANVRRGFNDKGGSSEQKIYEKQTKASSTAKSRVNDFHFMLDSCPLYPETVLQKNPELTTSMLDSCPLCCERRPPASCKLPRR